MIPPPPVACVMMQRNEDVLLEPWLAWHSYLFGHENLTVFDHGSTSAAVREILQAYESIGVHVHYLNGSPAVFERKTEIVSDQLRVLSANGQHDIIMPLDCDEFLALRTPGGFSVEPQAIYHHLESLKNTPEMLLIPYQFANTPGRPDLYQIFQFRKVAFTKGAFGTVDFGFHHGTSSKARGEVPTGLTHVHFHYKTFTAMMDAAQRKLAHLDLADQNKLQGYKGRSMHLLPYLGMTPDDYYARPQVPLFHAPALRSILRKLRAPLDFNDTVTDEVSQMLLPTAFNPAAYLELHQDVNKAKLDPLVHYVRFGFAEGRRLAAQKRKLGGSSTGNELFDKIQKAARAASAQLGV